jgi:hypothetical protein
MAYTTIDDPALYFNTVLYTGSGSAQDITTGHQPDMIWIKNRSYADHHQLVDRVRWVSTSNSAQLTPNATNQAGTKDVINSFSSTGYNLETGDRAYNSSDGDNFVSWSWKANGAGSSNTDGTINSTKTSANTTSGFSMVTYTGDDNSGATVGHGLGMAPSLIIVKALTKTDAWFVTGTPLGWNKYLLVDQGGAESGSSNNSFTGTAATSSVFSLGSDSGGNGSSYNYVAYLFSNVQGFSKVGTYTGNANVSGAFCFCGFSPAIIISKRTDATSDWIIWDNKRDGYNETLKRNYPNDNAAEENSTTQGVDFLSNGFKLRGTSSNAWNAAGATYIFMAFAEAPFVNSNGIPCNAR